MGVVASGGLARKCWLHLFSFGFNFSFCSDALPKPCEGENLGRNYFQHVDVIHSPNLAQLAPRTGRAMGPMDLKRDGAAGSRNRGALISVV